MNPVVLITGASRGIGAACARRFARSGYSVAILYRSRKDLAEALVQELISEGQDAFCLQADVADRAQAFSAVEAVLKRYRRIDMLVNNAAIWNRHGKFMEIPVEEWETYLDINVMGAVYCTRAALPGMIERKYGRIINVASVAGVYGISTMTHYSATKGALIAFTKALAKEVVKDGVLVNAVAPGSVSPGTNPDIDYHQPTPLSFMGRTGTDRENANLIAFLASDEASYISGQSIQIDGCRKTL